MKQVLQQQILAVVAVTDRKFATIDLLKYSQMTLDTIPVYRISDQAVVRYRSAIAFKLAPLWHLPALDIAHQLTESLATIPQNPAALSRVDFSIEVVHPGWIDFRLSNQGLAAWLQHWIDIPSSDKPGEQGSKINQWNEEKVDTTPQKQLPTRTTNLQNLFPIQYAHARCCSLLRLGHRQGLLKLSDLDSQYPQIMEPNPIPWLEDSPTMESFQGGLRFHHPAERHLIEQLIESCDRISGSSPVNGVQIANSLSPAFENFYSACRIWGEVKTETPKLAQARLGLVGVTQRVVRSLLDQLGVKVPSEL